MKRPVSDFNYGFLVDSILVIYNLDMEHRSVTNDIDNVIHANSKMENVDFEKYNIAYQD
jgi:phage-related protein